MSLVVLGVNHKTASLALREQIVVAPERLMATLQSLKIQLDLKEAVILSTCNRTEIYATLPAQVSTRHLVPWFVTHSGWSEDKLEKLCYLHDGAQAVSHLLRVACGLDSLVLGEPQILGQMKTAFATAKQARTLGGELSQLFQFTFNCAKRIRSQTRIGASPVSVAYAAVNLSKRIFASLPNATVMLLGAGQTAELVARHFKSAGVQRMLCANRTLDRAQRLARGVGGEAILLQQIPQYLPDADILVCSTASPLPMIGKGMMERAVKQRRHRPVLAVDLAVPRDIEAAVGDMEDVFLYTVDDLEAVISDNVRQRSLAAEVAEQIVDRQTEQFLALLRERNAVSRLCLYRNKVEALRQKELKKARQALNRGENPDEVLERFSRGFMNKVTHEPTVQMRAIAAHGDKQSLRNAERLLGLSNESFAPTTQPQPQDSENMSSETVSVQTDEISLLAGSTEPAVTEKKTMNEQPSDCGNLNESMLHTQHSRLPKEGGQGGSIRTSPDQPS